jgi:hypothetical protein
MRVSSALARTSRAPCDDTDRSMLTLLPQDILRVLLSFLKLKEICVFDSALLNHELRSLYLSATHGHRLIIYANIYKTLGHLPWVLDRGILVHDMRILNGFGLFRELASRSMTVLTTLKVSSFDISDSELEQLICPNLLCLTCADCAAITSRGLGAFLSHCRNLDRLCLGNTLSPSPDLIPIIIAHCPNLRHLHISNDNWWTDASLTLLTGSSLRLESLDLSHSLIGYEPIALLIQTMPSLLELKTHPRSPVALTLMVLRQIDLKCILGSDAKTLLRGLRCLHERFSDRIEPDFEVSEQLLEELLNGFSEMDVALRRLVDFLSHENKEVSDPLLRIIRILTLLLMSCLVLSWDGLGTSSVQLTVASTLLRSLATGVRCMQVQRMTERALESGRSQFFDHLVSCDLISVLVSAFNCQSKLTVSCDAIVSCLVRILKAGDEYKRLVDEMELPQLLAPLLETEFEREPEEREDAGRVI